MRILCLTPWFPSEPQDQCGNYILDSVLALKNLGHEVNILVSRPWRPKVARLLHPDFIVRKTDVNLFPELKLKQRNYASIPRNYFRVFSNFSYIKSIVPVLEEMLNLDSYDVIHAHGELAALAAVKVGKQQNIPVVVSLHGIETSKRFWKSSRKLVSNALMLADRVILVGEPLRSFFKPLLGVGDCFRIVPNGFRCFELNKDNEVSLQLNPLKIVSVSNLHEGKGIDINLKALAQLNQMGITNWIYTIVGAGAEKAKLQALSLSLGLTSNVNFIGSCKHNEVYNYLAQSYVFLLPSYREAFGIVYLEAMSCGLLTIAVQGQGAEAFIENNKTGFLVIPNSIDSVVDVLKEIIIKPMHMNVIAKQGKKFIKENFTWNNHAKKLTEVYLELTKK